MTTTDGKPGYTWVAEFETPLQYQPFTLNLSFSSDDGDGEVIAWGLFKRECPRSRGYVAGSPRFEPR